MADIGTPEIDIENISLKGASLSEVDLLVSVSLENGNPFTISTKSIDFEIFGRIDGNERKIGHGHYGEFQMPPGRSCLDIPVIIKNMEIVRALSEILITSGIGLRISGNACIDLKITSLNVPFSEERTFRF